MKKYLVLAACFSAAFTASAKAQSSGASWSPGVVLTASQMQNLDSSKVNVANGTATGMTRTGGSDTGTDISAAYVAATSPLSSYFTAASTNRFTVYLGGISSFSKLASDVQSSLAAGNITLYEHGVSLNPQYLSTAQRQAVQDVWGITGIKITEASGGGGSGMAELGCCTLAASDRATFGGKIPALSTLNLPDSQGGDGAQMTADAEAALEISIPAMMANAGTVGNVAPVMRPDGALPYIWSTDDHYAPNRKLALAMGALAIDMPATLGINQQQAAIDNLVDEISWAIKNNLRLTLMISPYVMGQGGCTFDPTYMEDTKSFVSYLLSKGPPPTEYVVEDYCGPDPSIVINGSTGDSVPQSNNQIALYLSSLPVSPPGTAVPTLANMVSEADALVQNGMYSSLNTPTFTFDAPYAGTQNPMPLNTLRNAMQYNIASLGGMAYQTNTNVNISGGNIYSLNPLNITVTNGQYLVQGSDSNISFAGDSGNSRLMPSSVDKYIVVYDPWTGSGSGFHFGDPTDPNAPTIAANNAAGSNPTGLLVNANSEAMITLHQNSSAFVAFGASSTTGKFLVTNLSSNQDLGTGIQFAPPGLPEASRPDISSSADGAMLTYNVATNYFKGNITALGDVNLNGDMGISSDISMHAGHSIGFATGTSVTPANIMGDSSGALTVTGEVKFSNAIITSSMTKAQILAISTPSEGEIVNDSTDHVPVIYENGSWYPMTLGTALSN